MLRTVGERNSMKSNNVTTRRRYQSVVIGDLRAPAARPLKQNKPRLSAARVAGRALQLKIDVPLLLAVITLIVFGLIMVYSASYDYSANWYKDPMGMFNRQLVWLALGSVAVVFLAFFDYHRWTTWALPAIAVTMAALLLLLVAGKPVNNALRGLLGGSIQPSELAKVVTIIYLSVWLYAKRDRLKEVSFGLFPLMAIIGVIGFLIVVQPDLSAAMTIMILGGLMFFLAGGDIKQISLLILGALIIGYALILIFPTGSERITQFMAGVQDPTTGSYHVRRAFGALAKGGWFGVGIGKAETKLTGLPVAPTDSIFAVIGEETGVVGAMCLIGVYMVILWRGLTIARRAPDQMGSLLAAGLSLWIVLEAFINMAVMVNLLPFAGNALPFISYGGSNLLVTMAAVGMIMNVSRLSSERDRDSGRQFNAVVDLRRGDGRRRVSGAGGVAGAKSSARTVRTARTRSSGR